jgi:vitamin B12 transporter
MSIRINRLAKTRAIAASLVISTSIFSHSLFAEALKANSSEKPSENSSIETIVVTANRQATPISKVAGGVTVIDAADIESSHATSLVELLSTTPGLTISQAGSLGGQTSLFVRGTESNHTAILINGQQQKISLGSVSLQYIDLNQIERIEIIRGSQANLYGSDTIGGVINIITKQGGSGSSISVENGSNKLQVLSASTSGSNFNVTLTSKRTEGIDSFEFDTQNDLDEFKSESGNIAYFFEVTDNLNTTFNLSGQRGKAEYDNVNTSFDPVTFLPTPAPSTLPYTEFKTHNIAVNNQFTINKNWQADVNIGESRTENKEKDELLSNTGQFSIFTHKITTLKAQGQLNENFSLNIGIDLADDTWEQEANFEESISNDAVFALLQFEKNKHLIGIAGRQDDNQQFGKHSTYRASYQFNWEPIFRPFATIGTGFKAPDFDELYSPWYIPNPDLGPETSRNSEIGFMSQSLIGNIQLNLFKNIIEDFIIYEVVDPVLFTGRLNNVEEVDIEGVELSHSIQVSQISVNSNASYIKAINNETDSELLRRPRRLANIQIDYDFGQVGTGKLKTGIGAHGESSRIDIDSLTFGNKSLPGYVIANAKLIYEINEQTELFIKANNLFDKEYQVIDGYNTQRANYSVALKARF